ncbi:MAG: hypothetical protein E7625_01375 [Ruminococcaceae bacterium]|nr:hypothetical protein [Oscillospiraceae bacterium]
MRTLRNILCLLLSLLLATSMLVACSPSQPNDNTETPSPDGTASDTQGLQFKLINGTYTVTGYTGTISDLTVPAQHQGVSVTAIGGTAFKDSQALVSVSLPATIETIGQQAFYSCTALESISLPDGLVSIGDNAFDGCTKLSDVTLPDTLTSIGKFAFAFTGLVSITIPESVAEIGIGVFSACKRLDTILVDSDNTTYHANENCLIHTEEKRLLAVSTECIIPVDADVTAIGDNVFAYRDQLTSVIIPDQITQIGRNAFMGCTNITTLTIPDSVVEIGEGAFSFCHSLISLEIPHSVTEIKDSTFSYCSSLFEVILHNTMTGIGAQAFSDCKALASIVFLGTEGEWDQISLGDAWDENTGAYDLDFRPEA